MRRALRFACEAGRYAIGAALCAVLLMWSIACVPAAVATLSAQADP